MDKSDRVLRMRYRLGGRPDAVDRHKYRAEIDELLMAGWAPRNLNVFMARAHVDYLPVEEPTLKIRREKLKHRLRTAPAYEKALRDEHVLLDTVRMKAGLILLQQRRLDAAVAMESQMNEASGGMGMVLEQVGKETERLAALLESYERSLVALGLAPGAQAAVNLQWTQSNVLLAVSRSVDEEVGRLIERLPEGLRPQLAAMLRETRIAETTDRLAALESQVRAAAPPPVDVDSPDGPSAAEAGTDEPGQPV